MIKLNDNEMKVLKALVKSCERNGYDFGFTDEAQYECLEGGLVLTSPQMSGYISALTKKGVFLWTEDLSKDAGADCNAVQMNLTPEAYRLAGCERGAVVVEGKQ